MHRTTVVFAAIAVASVAFASLSRLDGVGKPVSSARNTADSDVERRAYDAFSREQYSAALPLFEELVQRLKDQPGRIPAIEERIRVCQRNLAHAPTTKPARKPHPPMKPGEVRQLDIRELGNFDFDPDGTDAIPDDVVRLNGARLRLTGFMVLMDDAQRVSQFTLVPSLGSCCFGQPPTLQHTVTVQCSPGKSVQFTTLPLVVEGTLRVAVTKEEGYVVNLFTLTGATAKRAPD
jgi:hypothetical protein